MLGALRSILGQGVSVVQVIGKLIDLATTAYQEYQEQKRVAREVKRRESIDHAIKKEDPGQYEKVITDTLRNIRVNVD